MKRTLQSKQDQYKPGVLTQIQRSLGFDRGVDKTISSADRNALLLKLIGETETVMRDIEAGEVSALNRLRQLKHKLSLSTPSSSLPEAEPTITGLTEHRGQ